MAKGDRHYYSVRTGKHPTSGKYNLSITIKLFKNLYTNFRKNGYFDEYFGYRCKVYGYVSGKLGDSIESQIYRILRKERVWPIERYYDLYDESTLFDVIEFFHDSVSKPIKGKVHETVSGECGPHYSEFDSDTGKKEFREKVNEIIVDYKDGFVLSKDGYILTVGEEGLKDIFEAKIKTDDPSNIDQRKKSAILRFRRHRASIEERRNAVRELAGVLEYLRPKVKEILTKKDESDLFNIANNFAIRHHSDKQKSDYDAKIWLSWMFYFYLSTIYAVLNYIKEKK